MSLSRPSFRPTYANVVATLALLIAVVGFAGGPSAVASAVKKLAPNSVGTANLKNNAVTAAKVKDGSIGGAEIKNGSLGGIDVADGSLGGQDIADHSLGGQDIAAGSLGGYNLAAGTIGTREIADRTVSNDDISNDTLTFSKFSLDAKKGLSRYWDVNPVLPGSTLTGYGAIAYVDATIAQSGDPDVRVFSFSFPAKVETVAGPPATAGDADCEGDYNSPTAAPGHVCYYVKDDSDEEHHVGTTEWFSYNQRGFALKYTPGEGAGWTQAEIVWVYTAPTS